jgi:serine/threonine protein kinase
MTQEEFFKRYSYSIRTDKLGGGAFGDVFKAYDNVLNKYVAIKVAKVVTYGGKEFSLMDEFASIKDFQDHTNIAKYDKLYTFETPQGIFDYAIIQYYPHGNLSDLIKNETLSQTQKEDLSLQILEGLSFLHSHKVVHRDMKPSNILIQKHAISGAYIPKIADFGLSKKADQGGQSRFTNSFGGGTLEYSSPEQLKGQDLRFNTDLWAWAVITYELFTGMRLFAATQNQSTGSAEREKEIYEHILHKDIASALTAVPSNWQQALSSCLIRPATQRIKSAQAVKDLIHNTSKDTLAIHDDTTQITVQGVDDTTHVITTPKAKQSKAPKTKQPNLKIEENNGSWDYSTLGVLILLGVFLYIIFLIFLPYLF